jgi:hypothetical protein
MDQSTGDRPGAGAQPGDSSSHRGGSSEVRQGARGPRGDGTRLRQAIRRHRLILRAGGSGGAVASTRGGWWGLGACWVAMRSVHFVCRPPGTGAERSWGTGRLGEGCERGAAGHCGRQKRRHAALDAQSDVGGRAGRGRRGSGRKLHGFPPVRGFLLHIPPGDEAFSHAHPLTGRRARSDQLTDTYLARAGRGESTCAETTAAGPTARPHHRPRPRAPAIPARLLGRAPAQAGAHVCFPPDAPAGLGWEVLAVPWPQHPNPARRPAPVGRWPATVLGPGGENRAAGGSY